MRFTKKNRSVIYFISIFLIFILIIGFVSDRYIRTKGYSGIWDFLSTYTSNYQKSFDADYETLEINIGNNDFKKLEGIRERALKRGIMINENDSYVPAKLVHNGKKIKAELRLKGHMTDHLQDKKWSFRVKTKKGDAFMGMKRFSLQHPGTRNYMYEWIYHKMMEQEGIIALRYMFLKVKVNNEDWGIYALEEHFGQELVQNNERTEGPIIRYNPELYWAYRINEMEKIRVVEEFASMQSSYIEPYTTKSILSDSALHILFENAMQRLEAFRRGKLPASQVFDVEKLARFHAVIDLVGGHHSLDWSDVKYYYNQQTQLLEPVAYESFSIRDVFAISGSYKFRDSLSFVSDHHLALFSDTAFFAEYIRQLERIASKKWLDDFLKRIDNSLQNVLATVYNEFAYKKYDPSLYYKNVKSIQRILHPPKGFYAHLDSSGQETVLAIGAIESLPFRIYAMEIDTNRFDLPENIIVPSKQANEYVNYKKIKITLPENVKHTAGAKMKLYYSVLGSKEEKMQEVFSYAAYDEWKSQEAYMQRESNVGEFPFISVDENEKQIRVIPGSHTIKKDLVLPEGYCFVITEGTRLFLNNDAKIISRSQLIWSGSEDAPVEITTSDSSGQGIVLAGVREKSVLTFVVFRSLHKPGKGSFSHNAVLNIIESNITLNNCQVLNSKSSAIQLFRSNTSLNSTVIYNTDEDAVRSYFSRLQMNDCVISESGDDGLVLTGSAGNISGLKILNTVKSVLVKENSVLNGNNFTIENSKTALEAKDNGKISINNVKISSAGTGIKASKKGDVFGPASVNVKNFSCRKCKMEQEAEKGSVIKIENPEK